MTRRLRSIQEEIKNWHRTKFPAVPDAERPRRILGKFREEIIEFQCATQQPGYALCGFPEEAAEEAADVIITLLGWAAFSGIDLDAALEAKVAANWQRTFTFRGGRYYREEKEYPDAIDGD